MGVRGELFSSRIILPNRTYFFNVKENRMGDLYLNIVESKNRETGGFDRQSVILFADDLQEFLKGFDESLKVMEKAVREKRHGGADAKREERFERKERTDREDKPERGERPERGEKFGRGEKSGRGGKAEYGRKDRYDRAGAGEKSTRGERTERGGKDRYNRTGEKPGRGEKNHYNRTGEKDRQSPPWEKSAKNRDSDHGSDRRPKGNRSERGSKGSRVVVKRQDR